MNFNRQTRDPDESHKFEFITPFPSQRIFVHAQNCNKYLYDKQMKLQLRFNYRVLLACYTTGIDKILNIYHCSLRGLQFY